jgi:peptidylprolyl isomerase
MRHHPLPRTAWLLGASLLLVACAADGSEDATDGTDPAPSSSASTEGPPDADAILASVHPDRGEPPTELVITDLVEGTGATLSSGDRVTVHYYGVRWSDGGMFDASWNRGQPFTFLLGAGQVITGWDVGVEGMQVGGRRVLTIPPGLAYGDRGAGNIIGPGETLVFIVDAVDTVTP